MRQVAEELNTIIQEVTKDLPPCKVVILLRSDENPMWQGILHRVTPADAALATKALDSLTERLIGADIRGYMDQQVVKATTPAECKPAALNDTEDTVLPNPHAELVDMQDDVNRFAPQAGPNIEPTQE